MSHKAFSASIVLFALLASAASGLQLMGELFTGSHRVTVNQVTFDGQIFDVIGWAGDTMTYDTAYFDVPVFPRSFRLYARVDDTLDLPLRPPAFEEGVWYEFDLTPVDAMVRFTRVPAAINGIGQAKLIAIRPAQNPTSGPVRLIGSIPAGSVPRVEVYNGAGLLVQSFDGLVWNRRDSAGRAVPAGLYLLKVSSGTQSNLFKIILTD